MLRPQLGPHPLCIRRFSSQLYRIVVQPEQVEEKEYDHHRHYEVNDVADEPLDVPVERDKLFKQEQRESYYDENDYQCDEIHKLLLSVHKMLYLLHVSTCFAMLKMAQNAADQHHNVRNDAADNYVAHYHAF